MRVLRSLAADHPRPTLSCTPIVGAGSTLALLHRGGRWVLADQSAGCGRSRRSGRISGSRLRRMRDHTFCTAKWHSAWLRQAKLGWSDCESDQPVRTRPTKSTLHRKKWRNIPMLNQYNAIIVERALRAAEPAPHFPPIDDREAWQTLRDDLGEETVTALIAKAEEAAEEPIPPLPATLYLEVKRTGQREGYQQPMGLRRAMLADLCIGECLENQGRFLDAILDVAWAICEESSWAYPAHQFELTDIHYPYIDLGVAMTALDLAEANALVGSALDPALAKRIHDELERRVFTPYSDPPRPLVALPGRGPGRQLDGGLQRGVVGAAILAESRTRRAWPTSSPAARTRWTAIWTASTPTAVAAKGRATGSTASATTRSWPIWSTGEPTARSTSWPANAWSRSPAIRCTRCSAAMSASTSRTATPTCATHARSLPISPAGSTFPRWPGWPCNSRHSRDAPTWATPCVSSSGPCPRMPNRASTCRATTGSAA